MAFHQEVQHMLASHARPTRVVSKHCCFRMARPPHMAGLPPAGPGAPPMRPGRLPLRSHPVGRSQGPPLGAP